jgi:hypothetical protein
MPSTQLVQLDLKAIHGRFKLNRPLLGRDQPLREVHYSRVRNVHILQGLLQRQFVNALRWSAGIVADGMARLLLTGPSRGTVPTLLGTFSCHRHLPHG